MNNIKKQINHDCRKALFPTWIFSVISEIITFLIMIFSADKVADLCNSLFDKNIRLFVMRKENRCRLQKVQSEYGVLLNGQNIQ